MFGSPSLGLKHEDKGDQTAKSKLVILYLSKSSDHMIGESAIIGNNIQPSTKYNLYDSDARTITKNTIKQSESPIEVYYNTCLEVQ